MNLTHTFLVFAKNINVNSFEGGFINMPNKDKSNIIDEYAKIQQGSLVGRWNEVLVRPENIKDNNENFTDALDSPSLEEVMRGENYGGKEYHGI